MLTTPGSFSKKTICSLYVFTIKRTTYSIKGNNSKCIYVRIMPLYRLRLFDQYQALIAKGWHPHAVLL